MLIIGVGTPFAFSILALQSRSLIYFHQVSKRELSLKCLTSIPRKYYTPKFVFSFVIHVGLHFTRSHSCISLVLWLWDQDILCSLVFFKQETNLIVNARRNRYPQSQGSFKLQGFLMPHEISISSLFHQMFGAKYDSNWLKIRVLDKISLSLTFYFLRKIWFYVLICVPRH